MTVRDARPAATGDGVASVWGRATSLLTGRSSPTASSLTTSSPRPRWLLLAMLVPTLVALNVLNNLVLADRAYVVVNLVAAVGLVLLVRRLGVTWADLGLSRARLRRGVLVGSAVAGGVAGLVALAVAVVTLLPHLAGLLGPSAPAGGASTDLAWTVLVRIPFGTALPEELLFRSVVFGIVLGNRTRRHAVAWSAALFGLWHILPTLDAASAVNGGPAVIAVTVVATAAAGAALGWLRLHTGSIVAPIAVHAALNGVAVLASHGAATLG